MPQTISALAALVDGTVTGNADTPIYKVAGLTTAGPGDITFIERVASAAGAERLTASCVIIPQDFEAALPFPTIKVKAPKLAFAMIAEVLHPPHRESGIHPSAIVASIADIGKDVFVGAAASIGEGAEIGDGCQIAEGVRIGRGVQIGANTFIYPNAVIYPGVTIGERCVIHAGTVIGADGFGYVRGRAGYTKFPQIGTVVIEDEVEIGANSCVDRGALGETRIRKGTKIDNLVQVAHNVQIGERVVIAAQTGISGSSVINSDCVIGGQVGIGDHAKVLSGAIIGSQAGILPGKIVRPGVWWGTPVQPLADFKRQHAQGKGLGALAAELQELKKVVAGMMEGK